MGESISGTGIYGSSLKSYGIVGAGADIGVYARNGFIGNGNSAYLGARSVAADLYGDVDIHGRLTKSGGGFRIDHPLDPANQYLTHSFVESSDMKNIYDGVVLADEHGQATVELPAWFEAVNRDFRYQLTAIGGPAPGLHVSEEISDGRFKISGGTPGLKVSWQATGVRQDAWANANAIDVELPKPEIERGAYVHPELRGEPVSNGLELRRHPGATDLSRHTPPHTGTTA
jgi:hypothetical protein